MGKARGGAVGIVIFGVGGLLVVGPVVQGWRTAIEAVQEAKGAVTLVQQLGWPWFIMAGLSLVAMVGGLALCRRAFGSLWPFGGVHGDVRWMRRQKLTLRGVETSLAQAFFDHQVALAHGQTKDDWGWSLSGKPLSASSGWMGPDGVSHAQCRQWLGLLAGRGLVEMRTPETDRDKQVWFRSDRGLEAIEHMRVLGFEESQEPPKAAAGTSQQGATAATPAPQPPPEEPSGVKDALDIDDIPESTGADPAWATFAREFADGRSLLAQMEKPGDHAPAAIRWLVLLEGMSANLLPDGCVVFTMPSVQRIQRASAADKPVEARLAVQLALKKMGEVARKHGIDLVVPVPPPQPPPAQALPSADAAVLVLNAYRDLLDKQIDAGRMLEHASDDEGLRLIDEWHAGTLKLIRTCLTDAAATAARAKLSDVAARSEGFTFVDTGKPVPEAFVPPMLVALRELRKSAKPEDMRLSLGPS